MKCHDAAPGINARGMARQDGAIGPIPRGGVRKHLRNGEGVQVRSVGEVFHPRGKPNRPAVCEAKDAIRSRGGDGVVEDWQAAGKPAATT
jgi:hypothetical protein